MHTTVLAYLCLVDENTVLNGGRDIQNDNLWRQFATTEQLRNARFTCDGVVYANDNHVVHPDDWDPPRKGNKALIYAAVAAYFNKMLVFGNEHCDHDYSMSHRYPRLRLRSFNLETRGNIRGLMAYINEEDPRVPGEKLQDFSFQYGHDWFFCRQPPFCFESCWD